MTADEFEEIIKEARSKQTHLAMSPELAQRIHAVIFAAECYEESWNARWISEITAASKALRDYPLKMDV